MSLLTGGLIVAKYVVCAHKSPNWPGVRLVSDGAGGFIFYKTGHKASPFILSELEPTAYIESVLEPEDIKRLFPNDPPKFTESGHFVKGAICREFGCNEMYICVGDNLYKPLKGPYFTPDSKPGSGSIFQRFATREEWAQHFPFTPYFGEPTPAKVEPAPAKGVLPPPRYTICKVTNDNYPSVRYVSDGDGRYRYYLSGLVAFFLNMEKIVPCISPFEELGDDDRKRLFPKDMSISRNGSFVKGAILRKKPNHPYPDSSQLYISKGDNVVISLGIPLGFVSRASDTYFEFQRFATQEEWVKHFPGIPYMEQPETSGGKSLKFEIDKSIYTAGVSDKIDPAHWEVPEFKVIASTPNKNENPYLKATAKPCISRDKDGTRATYTGPNGTYRVRPHGSVACYVVEGPPELSPIFHESFPNYSIACTIARGLCGEKTIRDVLKEYEVRNPLK